VRVQPPQVVLVRSFTLRFVSEPRPSKDLGTVSPRTQSDSNQESRPVMSRAAKVE
jgi:hypothetical protein